MIQSSPVVLTRLAQARPSERATVDLTIVVPTFNERDNVSPLVARLSAACAGHPTEILFVDDSLDDTPEIIRQVAAGASLPVRLLHRSGADRVGGLSGAVAAGLAGARGQYVLVMDGDLQHPPELVPMLRDCVAQTGVQLAVASRYLSADPIQGLDGASRRWVSKGSTIVARWFFPRRVGSKCSDPMTGFFCVVKDAVNLDELQPQGFKILLEILVRHDLKVREIPFFFDDRLSGHSKASWRQGVLFLRQVLQLRGRSFRPAHSDKQEVAR